jgi:hypothetical protein
LKGKVRKWKVEGGNDPKGNRVSTPSSDEGNGDSEQIPENASAVQLDNRVSDRIATGADENWLRRVRERRVVVDSQRSTG